jgi:hypothetical protein
MPFWYVIIVGPMLGELARSPTQSNLTIAPYLGGLIYRYHESIAYYVAWNIQEIYWISPSVISVILVYFLTQTI